MSSGIATPCASYPDLTPRSLDPRLPIVAKMIKPC
jgi:hypothetical protein